MKLLLVSFAGMLLAVLGMSLGVLLGRRPIQGSCGGAGGQCGACSKACRRHAAGDARQQPEEESCQSR